MAKPKKKTKPRKKPVDGGKCKVESTTEGATPAPTGVDDSPLSTAAKPPCPPSTASVRYPGRTPAYIQRRIAFAEAFCKTGDACTAFLSVTPRAKNWKMESIRREARTLLHDSITEDTIAEINELNKSAIIPQMSEVIQTLSGIMRGTLDFPSSHRERIAAAKQLIPLIQTRETLEARRALEADTKPFSDPEAIAEAFIGKMNQHIKKHEKSGQ